ncbi:MAG: YjbH domain-containing protein [Alphaproteobacteria bacterium]|nr:YjbH domain-containing protein [Alphaproteobacteria bacterium SS10]
MADLGRRLLTGVMILALSGCQAVSGADSAPSAEPWFRNTASDNPVTELGRIGAIRTPTARMDPAGTIRVHAARREPYWVAGVSVQPLERLALTLRRTRDDRSPDLRGFEFSGGLDAKFLLRHEGEIAPQISLGVDAIAGNGIFGSEYLVASKRIGPVDLSLGMGWGRLAGAGPLTNPFSVIGGHFKRPERRQEPDRGEDFWFTGDRLGLFGSAVYRLPFTLPWVKERHRPKLILEYDSDQFWAERRFDPDFDLGNIPVNVGLSTPLGQGFQAGIAVERFKTISARLSWSWDATRRRKPLTGLGLPIAASTTLEEPEKPSIATPSQAVSANGRQWLDAGTISAEELAAEILGAGIEGAAANPLDDDVTVGLHSHGVPTLGLSMASADLRDLANNTGSANEVWQNAERSTLQTLPPDTGGFLDRASLNIRPETTIDAFEASTAAVARQSIVLDGQYRRGNTIYGAGLRVNLADNLDRLELDRAVISLPVRSDLALFADNSFWLENAYIGSFDHVFPDLYLAGLTGMFEEQYGGLNAQLLYWPHDAKWAVGGQFSQVFRRNPFNTLEFQEDVVGTGEVSGYYQFGGGTVGKMSVISYLGTEAGLRFDLVQPLGYGWKLESYLAFSDGEDLAASGAVTFAEVGGADFGVRLTAPLASLFGGRVKVAPEVNVRALGRDQAQRLRVPIELYDLVAPAHQSTVIRSWPGLGLH